MKHILIVHGYLLHNSGSCTFVKNIALEYAKLDYKVTICCQDHNAIRTDGINNIFYDPVEAVPINGKVNIFIPMLPYKNNILPVYIYNFYDGFSSKTITDMTIDEGDTHIDIVSNSIAEFIENHDVDFIIANHALFSPINVKRALHKAGRPDIPYIIKIHGSSLNFILENDLRWKSYVLEGLICAKKIICGTEYIKNTLYDIIKDVNILPQVNIVPYGVNTKLFSVNRVTTNKFKIIFFSHILNTKGLGELILTMPYIKNEHPDMEFHIVGCGTYETDMRHMLQGMYENNLKKFKAGAKRSNNKRQSFIAEHIDVDKYFKQCDSNFIIYHGYIQHSKLSKLLASCDMTVIPSKSPESFTMVTLEAIASGVYPLCANHSGLSDFVNTIRKYNPKIAEHMSIQQNEYGIDIDNMIESINNAIMFIKKNKYVPNELKKISKNYDWRVICNKLLL